MAQATNLVAVVGAVNVAHVFGHDLKVMRETALSCSLLRDLVPGLLPLPVGAVQALGQHAFGVLRCPTSARAFAVLLQDRAMRALDFARADGQAACQGVLVLGLMVAVCRGSAGRH